MNYVTRVFIFLGLVAISLQADAQAKYGIRAGLNINNVEIDSEAGQIADTKSALGFQIGAVAEFNLKESIGLQTGLLWSLKGFNIDSRDEFQFLNETFVSTYKGKFRYNYLEVPLNLTYRIQDFQLFAGPYVAMGITGKVKTELRETTNSMVAYEDDYDGTIKPVTGKVNVGDLAADEEPARAIDLGLNFGIGYQAGPVLLNLGYGLGMGNLVPEYDDENAPDRSKVSNRVLMFTATYFFGTEAEVTDK